MLKGKTVILGVTGSIAAYKSANIASMLAKLHCNVQVIMTRNACNFINPITFESLTNRKCIVDTFDRNFSYSIEHVSLAKAADAVLIAPASANIIAKLAFGLADDMLSTTTLACKCPKLIYPAMNTNMYENPILQSNLERLRQYGFLVFEPDTGLLACKDVGKGKFPKEEQIVQQLVKEIAFKKDMAGVKVLVTAGPTVEKIDPVRYITNHSSGKMGYALAKICACRGAEVTLVSGKTQLTPPSYIKNVVFVESAADMMEAVTAVLPQQDMIFKAAAVADYTPKEKKEEKMKKGGDNICMELTRTGDILAHIGKIKQPGQFVCGFSMETKDMVENSRRKLENKNLDMIVANNLKEAGAGFANDTNIVTIITPDGEKQLPLLSKEETALCIIDEALRRWNRA